MGTTELNAPELPAGSVDLLVLQALLAGPRHGYAIAQRIRQLSQDVLAVGESSLYTSLQRLLLNGWVTAEWGTSENNRRARYYTLTVTGRKHLKTQTEEFQRVVCAIQRVLRTV
jgi:PadR family transcriptional regulator PadR